jgi:peptidylprolyl isomerase
MKKSVWFIMLSIILPALVLTAGCGGAAVVAKAGDTVKVHYTGTLSDGKQFDSSVGKTPLQFTIGAGQVITGFDKAVTGMKVGEKKTVTIPAAEAYGAYRSDLVFEIDKSKLPSTITPAVGMQLQMSQQDGTKIAVTIKSINANTITMDANHALAGKDLTFALELVEIVNK